MLALSVLNALRLRLKPILPPWAHKALRFAWHRVALPPLRLASRAREAAGGRSAGPPAHLLAQYALVSADQFVPDGEGKHGLVRQLLGDHGVALPAAPRILDFGCGLGSTLAAFKRHLPAASCYGCDIRNDPIRWLVRGHGELKVARTGLLPPLPEDFTGFDLVYAISVWTHMPAAACAAWIAHLHDRLKPGGVLLFTFVEPSTDFVRRHGFDPATLPAKVRDSSGCLFDPGTEMTYMQTDWIERQATGKFEVRYAGPSDYLQWAALLQRSA